jgi:hypothetical protein
MKLNCNVCILRTNKLGELKNMRNCNFFTYSVWIHFVCIWQNEIINNEFILLYHTHTQLK